MRTEILYYIGSLVALVQAFVEVPKFNQMVLLYPGYFLHDGKIRDREIISLVQGHSAHALDNLHNTAALRMSWVLNKYGGRHAIGVEPIGTPQHHGPASLEGPDGQQYIFKNVAFGPFLASKYGNPVMVAVDKHSYSKTMLPFHGKQGIIRIVSYNHKHAGGHIGLWDCDHFYKSADWTTQKHIISVEFWESPDSYCSQKDSSQPTPYLDIVPEGEIHVGPRQRINPKLSKVRHHRRHRAQT